MAGLKQRKGCLPNGFRRAVAELGGGVDVPHDDGVGRDVLHHLGHINGVAEMVGARPDREDTVDHPNGSAAAVVINDNEIVVLQFVDDPFNVRYGEFVVEGRGEKSCKRFSDDDAVGADLFIRPDIMDQVIGHLRQNSVDHIRIVVAVDHCL